LIAEGRIDRAVAGGLEASTAVDRELERPLGVSWLPQCRSSETKRMRSLPRITSSSTSATMSSSKISFFLSANGP
jgi:hypothetical protein